MEECGGGDHGGVVGGVFHGGVGHRYGEAAGDFAEAPRAVRELGGKARFDDGTEAPGAAAAGATWNVVRFRSLRAVF